MRLDRDYMIVFLIDVDNILLIYLDIIINEVNKYGKIINVWVYGDWS